MMFDGLPTTTAPFFKFVDELSWLFLFDRLDLSRFVPLVKKLVAAFPVEVMLTLPDCCCYGAVMLSAVVAAPDSVVRSSSLAGLIISFCVGFFTMTGFIGCLCALLEVGSSFLFR